MLIFCTDISGVNRPYLHPHPSTEKSHLINDLKHKWTTFLNPFTVPRLSQDVSQLLVSIHKLKYYSLKDVSI